MSDTTRRDKFIAPQFICLTCNTVIGPVWDDDDHKCRCDIYEYEVIRLVPETLVDRALEIALSELNWLRCGDREFVRNRLQYWLKTIVKEQNCT